MVCSVVYHDGNINWCDCLQLCKIMETENIKSQRYDQGFEITIQSFERPRQWCDLKKTKIVYDVYVKRWIITTMKSYKSFVNRKFEPYKQELISR